MSIQLFIVSVCFFFFTIAVMVLARRFAGVNPAGRVTISAMLMLLGSLGVFFWDRFGNYSETDGTVLYKTTQVVLLFLGVYALVQLINWAIYEFVVLPRNVKLPKFLFDLIAGAILAVTLLMIIRQTFGTELSGILVTSTIASAIIGLALQDTLGNLVSGISLQIEAPFSIDDWVEIGGQEGQLVSQNWRTLTLLTRENHRVSLTNRFVANDKIINYSRPTRRQIHNIIVGIELDFPPEKVKKLLIHVMEEIKEVDPDPYMPAFIDEIGDFAIHYGMRFWINDYGDLHYIRNLVFTRLWYVLRREGINLAYPTQDLNLRMVTDSQNSLMRQRDVAFMIEKYRSFDWLEGLSREQIDKLAENSKLKLYTKGEKIVQQGDSGDSLFIVIDGEVGVYVQNRKGRRVKANSIHVSNFFGEMSLLTGQPRSASVIAEVDSEVTEINQYAFSELLAKDPQILEVFLEGLEKNKSNLLQIIAEADREDMQGKLAPNRSQLLSRIGRYLGIHT